LIYTSDELVIVDPGSPYEDEQAELAATVKELASEGRRIREIVLTHRHPDHVAGVNHLRAELGQEVNVAAHQLTAQALAGTVEVDRQIVDQELITLGGVPEISLLALHTPGHAQGHLCFYDELNGTLLSGDNVVGLGSVLIDPPEGNMRQYCDSLRRMAALPKLTLMLGGHGPAIANPHAKLNEYITHRLQREVAVLGAVRNGAQSTADIVKLVYTDVSPTLHPMAERAILAHLQKLAVEGMVHYDQGAWKPREKPYA
jgi:glyoxylase-like metal-dependent hydrolase (beta-lactamase superfamily II)